jgi:hypothetical protein
MPSPFVAWANPGLRFLSAPELSGRVMLLVERDS